MGKLKAADYERRYAIDATEDGVDSNIPVGLLERNNASHDQETTAGSRKVTLGQLEEKINFEYNFFHCKPDTHIL